MSEFVTNPLANFREEIWTPNCTDFGNHASPVRESMGSCGRRCSWSATSLGVGTGSIKSWINQLSLKYLRHQCKKRKVQKEWSTFSAFSESAQKNWGSFGIQARQTERAHCPVICWPPENIRSSSDHHVPRTLLYIESHEIIDKLFCAEACKRDSPYIWKAVRRRKETQRATTFPAVKRARTMPSSIPTMVAAVSWLPSCKSHQILII